MEEKYYLEGFEDALEMITALTNMVGTSIVTKPTTPSALMKAVDAYISLTYVMKIQLDIMKDELDDSCNGNCDDCDLTDMFDAIFNKEEI